MRPNNNNLDYLWKARPVTWKLKEVIAIGRKLTYVLQSSTVPFIDFVHVPLCCCVNVIRADRDSSSIRVYDGRGSSDVLHTFDKLHSNPVVMMKVMRSSMNVCF